MAELMKKLWSPDPINRPTATALDSALMDMNNSDAEPVTELKQGEDAKRTTVDMLYEIFPKHVADALKAGQKVAPENHDNVTVVFSDIVSFTDISQASTPMKVSTMLDRLYLAFDKIARKHSVFKVETIGGKPFSCSVSGYLSPCYSMGPFLPLIPFRNIAWHTQMPTWESRTWRIIKTILM